MFGALGIKKIWERISQRAKPENPEHAKFRAGVEQAMQANGIKDARMVGGFFKVGQEFMDTLYGTGFRTKENGRYDFSSVAVFVADIQTASLDEDLSKGRSIAFIGAQDDAGNVQLLNVSNIARSHTLDVVNSFTARKAANGFRELLKVSAEQITPEYAGYYMVPEKVAVSQQVAAKLTPQGV